MSGVSSMMTSTPGGGLERADVPSLAADDPALHLVARQRDRGDGALGGVLGGEPLDGDREDAAGVAVGALPGLLLDVARERGGLAPRLVLHPLQHLAPRVFGGEPGDALQLAALLLGQPVGLALARLERRSRWASPSSRLLRPRSRASISSTFRSCARDRSSARRSSRSHSSRRRRISRSRSSRSLSDSIRAATSDFRLGRLGLAHRVGAEPVGFGARGGEDTGRRPRWLSRVERG